MGIFIYCCWHRKNIGIYTVFLLIVVDTERILEYIRYFYIFVLTQKELLSYRVFLYICVDTERILDILGIIYLIYVHKKE